MKRFLKNEDVKVLYMGTPKMSARVLEALIQNGYTVVGLVCQEDKEVGRHKRIEKVPTKCVAEKYGIPVFQPHRIRLDYEFAKMLDFDVIVTMAYGQIIPQGLLDLSHVGNVNLHGSILPYYRGAAPIQRAIMNGEKETGITLMEMVAAMDAGETYDIEKTEIKESDTYSSLGERLSEIAASLIVKDLLLYANHELKGEKQDESKVTFANKIKPEEEHMPLSLGVTSASCYIRALSEEPGAYLLLGDKKIKIYDAKVFSKEKLGETGTLIPNKKHFLLQLSDGILELLSVQLEGKKRMDGISFLQGAHLPCPTFFR